MIDFKTFQDAISRQFDRMVQLSKSYETRLFRVVIDKDTLWETYLNSFPTGSNPLYKERTEHDCQCCKSFVRNMGDVVALTDEGMVSIWDIGTADKPYEVVAEAMSKLVKTQPISNVFLTEMTEFGLRSNRQETEHGSILWPHFYLRIPSELTYRNSQAESIAADMGALRTNYEVTKRGLTELTPDAISTVLELIAQNSLYRGEEHKPRLEQFAKLKQRYEELPDDRVRDRFLWMQLGKTSYDPAVLLIRNTVIGQLLIDLSNDVDLEQAVKKFEAMVAPANYKRPTALVTHAMVAKARAKIESLGLSSALERRYAEMRDITINNILFVDRNVKAQLKDGVWDDIATKATSKPKSLDKIEEIEIEDFVNRVLPKADSIEVFLENRHTSNLVSLVAPVHADAKPLFKWDNGFSWSYNGDMTDSIKERVKQAGGRVEGDLRCSLSWFNYDDLDLHMREPGGREIYYGNKGQYSPNGGMLDVDMNAYEGKSRNAVENIVYGKRSQMRKGVYELVVHQFSKRETIDVGFEVEIEFDGTIHTFAYTMAVPNKGEVVVAKIKFDGTNFELIDTLPSANRVKSLWGLNTQNWQPVSTIMLSPNHWDDNKIGNRHWFFMLQGCKNEGQARGFFNEFLASELNEHRKVLEIVASKMKTQESTNQLSGLGFSSTQRNHLLCRVKGSFTRVVKIMF